MTIGDGVAQGRDRFQGALLGLSFSSGRPYFDTDDYLDHQTHSLAKAIGIALSQTQLFLSAPHVATVPKPLLATEFLLPASVPILLRYHDSHTRRLNRLPHYIETWQANSQNTASISPSQAAQILMLGNLLEGIGRGAFKTPELLALLEANVQQYAVWPAIDIQYRQMLDDLAKSLDVGYLLASKSEAVPDWACRSFIAGAASALSHPESYLLAINPFTNNHRDKDSSWISKFVAGLLSGYLGGYANIPTLWQTRPQSREAIAMSDGLFDLWTGTLSPIHLSN